MRRFAKAYVEITNICNLDCGFCHKTKRSPRSMSADEFKAVISRLSGHTDYIYFHLLGEPLLHPELEAMLGMAADAGFNCCITTNGFLLRERAQALRKAKQLYKLSVSLHSFEANSVPVKLEEYLEAVWEQCSYLAMQGTICVLRLWNEGGESALNGEIIDFLRRKTQRPWEEKRPGSLRLCENVCLENAARFQWPDLAAQESGTQFCRGLRDQIAVLCDGTLVPCCLDADGELALGNLLEKPLEELLDGERARLIYDGFSRRAPREELCRRCGYAARFNR